MTSNSHHPQDQDLVLRAIEGDMESFGELYERYVEEIYNYAFYRVNEVREAEDITETAFLKAFECLTAYDENQPIENFRAWIYRITRNKIIDHYRTRKETVPLVPELPLTSLDMVPEADIENRELFEAVLRAIRQLNGNYKEVILCRFINGLSHRETAKVLDLTENHVRTLQFRALIKVRKILMEEKV